MATQSTHVANPTGADVTVNAKTAVARSVTVLAIDDAVVTEYNGFLAAGCAMVRAAGSEDQKTEAAHILYTGESQVT